MQTSLTKGNNAADLEKEDKLIELLAAGKTIQEAGILAGYSKQYARTSITRKWQSDRFVGKLLKRHRAKALTLLPKSHETDKAKFTTAQDAISTLQKAITKTTDPTDRLGLYQQGMAILSKLDNTQERISKAAGLHKEHEAQGQTLVSVKDMQVILSQTIHQAAPEAIDVTPEAEVQDHG